MIQHKIKSNFLDFETSQAVPFLDIGGVIALQVYLYDPSETVLTTWDKSYSFDSLFLCPASPTRLACPPDSLKITRASLVAWKLAIKSTVDNYFVSNGFFRPSPRMFLVFCGIMTNVTITCCASVNVT